MQELSFVGGYNFYFPFLKKILILKTNTMSTFKKVKNSYTQEEVDRMLDEQASKTTAYMLEKFKGYKSKDEVIILLKKVLTESKEQYSLLDKVGINKWIEENL